MESRAKKLGGCFDESGGDDAFAIIMIIIFNITIVVVVGR
jgi:hypothetical protein